MPTMLTTEQILALAPDAASATSATGLATVRAWVTRGQNERAAWGECQGSGQEPYRTQIDLASLAFRCSCPSRKFPCKHGLGLLLLFASQPAAFPQAPPPAWVAEWLAGRERSAQRRAEPQGTAGSTEPAAAERHTRSQLKTAAARERRVAAGMQELSRWLRDQLRQGLASVQSRPIASWEAVAARMVDAQAPGIARQLRELGGVPASGEGWQGRLLERLGRLHLLAEGFARLDTLAPETRADLRAAIGFTQSQEDVLAQPGLRDRWMVLGQAVVDEDRLRVQRTWLWGRERNHPALILSFSAAGQPLDHSLVPGTAVDAELSFFPGSVPLRALVKQQFGAPASLSDVPGGSCATATGAYVAALACTPWLERYPLLLGPVTLRRDGARWLVEDAPGDQLPLALGFSQAWHLLALSAGQPFTIFGEWDGEVLAPLSAWMPGYLPLIPGAPGTGGRPLACWQELVAAAVVGTERRATLPAPPSAAFQPLIARCDAGDPAGNLLSLAAAVAVYQRAARQPLRGTGQALRACPSEDLAECSVRAAGHLALMLGGTHRQALAEWLTLLATSGQRPPAAHLAALLALGTSQASLRPRISAAIGARGHWLATQHPEWAALYQIHRQEGDHDSTGAMAASQWETGTREQRLALLARIREAQPAQARELIAASWSVETADTRAAMLATLERGLSMADEPFLEAALDDRGREVRTIAAELLARLPEGRLAQRMAARTARLLSWTPPASARLPGLAPAQPARVAVTLPAECDKAMARDGIDPKPRGRTGERAWWLGQLLARTPPQSWCRAWHSSAATILNAELPEEWHHTVVWAWVQATRRYGDQEWAAALADLAQAGDDTVNLVDIIDLLPPDRRETLLTGVLQARDEPLTSEHRAFAPLRACPGPWSQTLGRAVLDGLERMARQRAGTQRLDWQLDAALGEFGLRMPTTLAAEVARRLPGDAAGLAAFVTVVQFRAEMQQALQLHDHD